MTRRSLIIGTVCVLLIAIATPYTDLVVQGTLVTTLSLVPGDHEKFSLEGFGQYYVVRKTTKEIMFSASYHIIDDVHSLKAITEDNSFDVKIKQHMIRHFAAENPHYFHDVPFTFRLYTKLLKDGVYSIDYERNHELIVDNEVVGYLQFRKPHQGKKVIDLRGIKYIKNDY